ncbi:MAG: CxxxxCH/CxxCH domain c-type cytochrome [Thermodesulfobacteriota bacterium]
MKKRQYAAVFLLPIAIGGFVGAAGAAQSPHGPDNGIDCLDCHGDHNGTVIACTVCHDNVSGSSFSRIDAPAVESHAGFSCQTCHDPHTSSQCSLPLVAGSFSGYQVNGQTTTFFVSSRMILDPAWSDPARWPVKSGSERGLILTVAGGLLDSTRTPPAYVDYSAEVVAADASSITVNGTHAGAALDGSTDFALIYGQLIRPLVTGRAVHFGGPTTFAANDGLAANGGDATPDGICQVCHTRTKYWRSDGSLASHNSGQNCTSCHDHAKGFNAGCASCHGNPPVADIPGGDDGLVLVPSPTGSATAGAHDLHAGAGGFQFSCDLCHAGGMPASPISGNDRIQIGFAVNPAGVPSVYDGQVGLLAPYGYEGTAGTTVTTNGSLTCANIYCHSNGAWVSTGRMNAHVTPPWNAGGPLACDSCHPYPMRTGPDDPRKDTHTAHAVRGYGDCVLCHQPTIADHRFHSNKIYDVAPAPLFPGRPSDGNVPLSFTYVFAPGGGTCSANSCHAYWGYSDPVRWGMNSALVVTPFLSALHAADTDRTITFDASRSACYETVDGVVEERSCDYEWAFGGSGSVSGGNNADVMVYRYDAEGEYTVTLTMRESITGKTASDSVVVRAENVTPPPATADFATALSGRTVTLTGTLPAGISRAYIYWGDRKTTQSSQPATDLANGLVHTYARAGSFSIRVQTVDASYNKTDYTTSEDGDLLVIVP